VAAVRAAAAIQRALAEHNTADSQRAVEVRIGIHSGQVTERDGDLLGQAVHATARVMAEAVGGEILITDEIRKDAEPQLDYSFLDSGLFWLRGFAELWRLYEVSWNDTSSGPRPGAASTPLTAFVERDAERARLRRLVDETLVGRGRLALVVGEAGRRQVTACCRNRRRGTGTRHADTHRPLCGDERDPALLALCGDHRAGNQQPA
jgi:hypothetical protein